MKVLIDDIVRDVTRQFRTFGAGQDSQYNPLTHVLKDKEPSFAAGVDVREVVEFIVAAINKAK